MKAWVGGSAGPLGCPLVPCGGFESTLELRRVCAAAQSSATPWVAFHLLMPMFLNIKLKCQV